MLRYEEITLRGKYSSELRQCVSCGYMHIENPYWLPEAYIEPINISDTGYVSRNLANAEFLETFISGFLRSGEKYVDFGAGFGLLVRHMRDKGFDFKWHDTYTKNIFSRGFEWRIGDKAELASCFEVFEHLTNPLATMRELSDISDNILFSTLLLPNPAPKVSEWWYYGMSHGQHISFHTEKSLSLLGQIYGYTLTTNGVNMHLFHRHSIPKSALRRVNSRWFKLLVRWLNKRTSLNQSDYDYTDKLSVDS